MTKAEIVDRIECVRRDLYAKSDYWFKRAQMAFEQNLPSTEIAKTIANAAAYDYAERLVGGILKENRK